MTTRVDTARVTSRNLGCLASVVELFDLIREVNP